MSPREFEQYLLRLGVIQDHTRATIWEQPAEGRARVTIAEELEEFIRHENGSSNTFAIVYLRKERLEQPARSGRFVWKTIGHAITAVRLEDGSFRYIDFQSRPPGISLRLNPNIYKLYVWPTTTDYRYNRHMFAGLRDGRPVDVFL